MMGQQGQGLPPGFRFSPTDEELVMHYLKNRACGKDFQQGVIAEVDIYKHEPWDLPEKSALPSRDPVWYFFNAQDKRHSHTARINRTTSKGYWKATGKDRKIFCGPHTTVGIKKTLIYYEGRAPSGKRTDWIMHEYKLDEEFEKRCKVVCSAALCRVRKKGGPGPRNGEQYGAPINEWGEDVEDDVDEKLPVLPESRYELSASGIPNQFKDPDVQEEKVLLDIRTEDCGSNDFSHAEGGPDINTEQDLYAFFESFLFTDNEATSLGMEMAPSVPVLDRSYINHYHFDGDTNSDLNDIERLFDLETKNVHDILHPSSGEEQILGELLHLANGGQGHTSEGECSMRILPQPAVHIGGDLYVDDVGPSGAIGDFIELYDMNSPLDGFVMRSPLQGSYYDVHDEQQLPFATSDWVETFAWSPDILHTQGSATRRARLQIAPSSVNSAHFDTQQQDEAVRNSRTEVNHLEVSSDNNLQTFSGTFKEGGQKTDSTSGSGSDSDKIANVVKFSPKSFLSKHISPYTVTMREEMQPQLFFTATTESGQNCEAGLDPTNGSISKHAKSNGSIDEAGLDCEAGLNPTVSSSAKMKATLHDNSVIGQLVLKVKSLNLGGQMVQLERSLSTTINDKVFALGKPVAQLFPFKDYVNPYHSLRRGAVASLGRLALAVLLLFFLFLGIHMLTKYVLSMAA